MKNMQKHLIGTLIFGILIFPLFSFAAPLVGAIVPCDGTAASPCDFSAFMKLVNNIINYALFTLALPIAAIMFAYAGIKLVTSGGSEEARNTAKRIFTNTALGLIIATAAYLIISLILSILSPGKWTWIGFN